jgi:hypothetical protein
MVEEGSLDEATPQKMGWGGEWNEFEAKSMYKGNTIQSPSVL